MTVEWQIKEAPALPADVLVLEDLLERLLALVGGGGAVVAAVDGADEESVEEGLLEQLR